MDSALRRYLRALHPNIDGNVSSILVALFMFDACEEKKKKREQGLKFKQLQKKRLTVMKTLTLQLSLDLNR